jgi:hypothetical protein
MIPFQGLIAEIFAVIGLIRLWRHPLPIIWWTLLILFFVEWFLIRALKQKLLQTGDSMKCIGLTIPTLIAQLSEIGIGIYSFF